MLVIIIVKNDPVVIRIAPMRPPNLKEYLLDNIFSIKPERNIVYGEI